MLFAGLLVATSDVFAATPPAEVPPSTQPMPVGNQQNIFIYAYPGDKCPGGSERFDVPDQLDAGKSGAVYCRYVRRVIPARKVGDLDICPNGMKIHVDTRVRPEAGHIWCEVPNLTR